jgi:Fe-S-cluster containining protein
VSDEESSVLTCEECAGQCCRHVATQIEPPSCKRDYDHIRWYLMHKDVHVFIDHDKDWFLEFVTDCDMLADDHHCGIYEKRPNICRSYGDPDEETCEFHAADEPHTHRFSNAVDFDAWLDSRGVDWRWKTK